MGKKPELRPNKGWKWRVIICDDKGKVAADDVMYNYMIPTCAQKLLEKNW